MAVHSLALQAIKDGIRERYRRKIVARASNDETSAVALVMIDTLLEMILEVLDEYDRQLRNGSGAGDAVH